jgi:chromosome segregation ATPase
LNSKLSDNSVDLAQNQQNCKEAFEMIEKARKIKREVASEVKAQIFQQNELELEIKGKQKRIGGFTKQIEKVEPMFGTLQRIEQKCVEQNLVGYKGLLIDFISCKSENLMPCIDLAAKSKLFSIIVDTLETAKQVLDINKSIKGGVINIFPLETLTSKPMPQIPAGVKSMMEVVKVNSSADPRIEGLVQNIFSKVVLVKSYDDGMRVAKDHNLTCITADLEIVYAGAFLTRVGHYNRSQMDRYSIYQQVQKVKSEIMNKNQQIKEVVSKRDQNDQQDLQALRDLQQSELALSQLRQGAQLLNSTQFDLKTQLLRKQNNLREIEK